MTHDDVIDVDARLDLDWASLAAYLQAHLPGVHGEMSVQRFTNGAANLTFLVSFGELDLVVRRPPFGRLAPGAHDIHREHTALASLAVHYPRAPRALLFCDDHSVFGADFVVLEYRVGVIIRRSIPLSMAHHHDVAHRVGMAAIEALADLHRLDPSACGLADLGNPNGFVERQLRGWQRRWDLVSSTGDVPSMTRVAARLEETLPRARYTAVLHNDFKLDNCQFDPDDPDCVASVFDWDQATVGDPLVDLGLTLNYWPCASGSVLGPVIDGLPNREAVIARYGELTGFELPDVRWYQAFAAWRTAIVLQQLRRRFESGDSDDARMAGVAARVRSQAEVAETLLVS